MIHFLARFQLTFIRCSVARIVSPLTSVQVISESTTRPWQLFQTLTSSMIFIKLILQPLTPPQMRRPQLDAQLHRTYLSHSACNRALRLQAERQRRHIQQQNVAHLAAQHTGLNGSPNRDHLVGVDALVWLFYEYLSSITHGNGEPVC